MPCAVNGPDAGQALQLLDRGVAAHRAQALAVERALRRGLRERAQGGELALGQTGEALELGDHAGRRERRALLAADRDALAELLGDARLERDGLRRADALADDEPGAGLEGRREAHRAAARDSAPAGARSPGRARPPRGSPSRRRRARGSAPPGAPRRPARRRPRPRPRARRPGCARRPRRPAARRRARRRGAGGPPARRARASPARSPRGS